MDDINRTKLSPEAKQPDRFGQRSRISFRSLLYRTILSFEQNRKEIQSEGKRHPDLQLILAIADFIGIFYLVIRLLVIQYILIYNWGLAWPILLLERPVPALLAAAVASFFILFVWSLLRTHVPRFLARMRDRLTGPIRRELTLYRERAQAGVINERSLELEELEAEATGVAQGPIGPAGSAGPQDVIGLTGPTVPKGDTGNVEPPQDIQGLAGPGAKGDVSGVSKNLTEDEQYDELAEIASASDADLDKKLPEATAVAQGPIGPAGQAGSAPAKGDVFEGSKTLTEKELESHNLSPEGNLEELVAQLSPPQRKVFDRIVDGSHPRLKDFVNDKTLISDETGQQMAEGTIRIHVSEVLKIFGVPKRKILFMKIKPLLPPNTK
jgi:hypothetical protein